MKTAFWGYFIILMGVIGIAIVLLFQDVTTTNDQNYYLAKEVTEAAMIDSIDMAYYRYTNGKVAINKEKFVENFIRRLAESAGINKTYDIKIYDIVEMPPKVSLTLGSKSNIVSFSGDQFNIINRVDAIIETKDSSGS